VLLASFQTKSRTRILINTRALLFFGVPHRGFSTEITKRVKTELTISKILFRAHQEDPFPSKEELRRMLEAFATISSRFQIYSFCPTRATNSAERSLISDSMTYIMGLSNEDVLSINSRLSRMVKFHSIDDPNYRKILSVLQRISAESGFLATRDWQREQMFRLDGEERYAQSAESCEATSNSGVYSESARQWFTDLRSDAHRVIDNRPIARRSKIAILDSGIDWSHPSFQEAVVAGRIIAKSFVEGLRGDQDSNGHGTHAAHVALKVAPNSKLFIARVIEDGGSMEFERNSTAIVEVSTGPQIYISRLIKVCRQSDGLFYKELTSYPCLLDIGWRTTRSKPR